MRASSAEPSSTFIGMCIEPALSRLLERTGCLERLSLPIPAQAWKPVMLSPVYLLHVPQLELRRRRMLRQLTLIGAPDLTLIGCANREDVEQLSAVDRTCLHPRYVVTHWSSRSAPHLSNGTLSLALKHQCAYLDIVRRRLAAALILEDDAVLPQGMWAKLASYAIPADAHIFFAGSYSQNPRGGSLLHEDVSSQRSTVDAAQPAPLVHVRSSRGRNGTRPAIVGSNAYVVFLEGARLLLQPVLAETDVQLSLLPPSPLCQRTPPTCYPALGTQHCGPVVSACPIQPPPHQYGPTRWLIWQDVRARDKLSHHALHSPATRGKLQIAARHRRPRANA